MEYVIIFIIKWIIFLFFLIIFDVMELYVCRFWVDNVFFNEEKKIKFFVLVIIIFIFLNIYLINNDEYLYKVYMDFLFV